MNIFKKIKLAFLALILVSTYSCNNNDASQTISGPAIITIKLVDEPGDFEEVNVEIIDVMVKMNDDSEDEGGWESINPMNTGVHNLLDFTGGESLLLANEVEMPAGELSQIRLVLGEDNTVVMTNEEGESGEPQPLRTPSGQQSGLKVKVNEELLPGFTYGFTLDFDVDKSVVIAGNSGNINLKPVIRASAVATSGIITGTVSPSGFQSMASVEVDGETISAYTDENGVFALNGVPAGIYELTVTPDPSSGYAIATVEGVEVVNGEITDVGIIELVLLPGSIKGTVTNEGITATASIEVDGETVNANTNESGVFLLENVPVGTYTVTVSAEGFTDKTISDVEVVSDTETDLGEITLE